MTVAEPEAPSRSSTPRLLRPWIALGLVVISIAASLALVVATNRVIPAPEKRRFEARYRRHIASRKPEFVLIGNSMVGTRIHERTLNKLIAPDRSVVLSQGGSRMAVWYLLIKNSIVAAGVHPKRVIVFFRYTELTDLTLRESGLDRMQIERATPELDPIVENKLAPPPPHPVRRLAKRLGELVPLERQREKLDDPATRFAFWLSPRLFQDVDAEKLPEVVNGPFALENLRAASATTTVDVVPEFSAVVESSLLPDMIELTKSSGIPLAFVRIRPQDVANGRPEGETMRRYVADLGRYLQKRGVTFVDMHDATWEGADLYKNGDHIAPRHKARYTRLFHEHLPELFR